MKTSWKRCPGIAVPKLKLAISRFSFMRNTLSPVSLFFLLCYLVLGSHGLRAQAGVKQKLALAEQYFGQEDYQKALDELDPLLDRGGPQRAYRLGFDSYGALDEWHKAERLSRRFFKKLPNRGHIYLIDEYYAQLQQGQERQAQKTEADILARIAEQPGRAYSYGKRIQQQGYPKLALKVYQKAEAQRRRMRFAYQKALVYGELGEIQNMYRMYVAMVEQNPAYLNTVKVLLGRAINKGGINQELDFLKQLLIRKIQQDGSRRLNDLLIYLYTQEGNLRGAFVQLQALARKDQVEAGELMRLARISDNNQAYDLSQEIYAFVRKNFTEGTYHQKALVGKLHSRYQALENREEEAKPAWKKLAQAYQKADEELSKSRLYPQFLRQWARILAYPLTQDQEAVRLLEKAIQRSRDPQERARSQILLADVLLYQGKRWDAIIYYKRAEADLEQTVLGQEAKFKRAQAAYFTGDFEWAQGIFDVLKRSTSKEIANDAMRYSLLITENMALDSTTEALETYARADLLQYRGILDSALGLLERMPIAFPGHEILDDVSFLKGRIYGRQGRDSLARKQYASLLANFPESTLADDALMRLAQLHEADQPEKAMDLYRQLFVNYVDSFFAAQARQRFRTLRGDTLE